MISELLLFSGSVFIGTMVQANKSAKIDEQAMHRYAKAFSKEQEAKRLVAQKEMEVDESVLKLAHRKKAIIDTTIKDFIKVYEKIQNVCFTEGAGIKELSSLKVTDADIDKLSAMSVTCSKPLSEKEIVVNTLFKGMIFGGGIGGTMIKESERSLSAANSQFRAANVTYSQAETIAVMYDAIKDRADRMSDLLKKMNALTVNCLSETKNILSRSSIHFTELDNAEKLIVINCINWIKALKDILDTPLFSKEGELEQQSEKAIATGEAFVNQINMVI